MSRLCLVLTGKTLNENRQQLIQYRKWIDMAEVRADLLDRNEWSALNAFSTEFDLDFILTLRKVADGGNWAGDEQERESFFRMALNGRWAYWDLEDNARLPQLEREWLSKGGRLVVSFHDFHGVPPDLAERLSRAQGPATIVKAAVTVHGSADFARFLNLTDLLSPGDHVVLAMGPYGTPSRVLAEKLGNLWTYASVSGLSPSLGHYDPVTLSTLYRFNRLTPQTKLLGIIGNPVHHSKSPAIHNAGMEATAYDGVYVPFLTDDLESFFLIAKKLGIQGFSVTIPFKEKILPYLAQITPAVKAIGACNTVWKEADGWHGDNTDAQGFLAPLQELWGTDLTGKCATVVGTGGAARSIVWALRNSGAEVLVLGRNASKAEVLATELGASWGPLTPDSLALISTHDDLIVQTTNVGMGDLEGQNPLDWYEFHGGEVAYDIIYVPERTAFIQAAEASGCRILLGKDMLLHQAVAQFLRFTGMPYPETLPF